MNASTLTIGVTALLVFSIPVQEIERSRLKPITAPVRNAGVYHVGTGTWTRNTSLAQLAGPDVIYNNTCNSGGYFFPMNGWSNQSAPAKFQHRSCIPSPSHPYVQTIVPGRTGFDEAPGCSSSYVVDGFQFAYCSEAATTVDWQLEYADSYTLCGVGSMVPTQSFQLTGLPGGAATGVQRCWIVDVDLAVASLSFIAQADGDGTYAGTSQENQFGWSWSVTRPLDLFSTGPIIAGDSTWTGGPSTGPLSPCTGTDGTIWDSPVDLAEEGTGMASNDFYRLVCPGCTWSPPGTPEHCWYFGGDPHADFWLKLFANAGCPPPTSVSSFCHPGQGGVVGCPCGNPPAAIGKGCDNSSATGGAMLAAFGVASLTQDTLGLQASGEKPHATSLVLQGDATLAAGVIYAQGVRCIGGHLRRLYLKMAVDGVVSAPVAGDASISSRSASLGDPIPPGGTRHYMIGYRDPTVLGGCPPASTLNMTQGLSLTWVP